MPRDSCRILRRTFSGNERDVTDDNPPLPLKFQNTQCVKLFEIVLGMLTGGMDDPACGGIEGFTEGRQFSRKPGLDLAVRHRRQQLTSGEGKEHRAHIDPGVDDRSRVILANRFATPDLSP